MELVAVVLDDVVEYIDVLDIGAVPDDYAGISSDYSWLL